MTEAKYGLCHLCQQRVGIIPSHFVSIGAGRAMWKPDEVAPHFRFDLRRKCGASGVPWNKELAEEGNVYEG